MTFETIDIGTERDKAHWPDGVRTIGIAELDLLGIDAKGHLYWDGKPVVTQQRLALTAWQKVVGLIVGGAAFFGGLGSAVQGVNAGHDFACKMHWSAKGCSGPARG